jgi:hypothetical protein
MFSWSWKRLATHLRRAGGLPLAARAELSAVELGWQAHVPALPIAARGGVVSTAYGVEVSEV